MKELVTPTREQAADLLPMFVYGTLRVGQWNAMDDDVHFAIADAKIPGAIYFVSGKTGYPVAKLNEPGLIVGDILFYEKTSRNLRAIVGMETRAGYDMRPAQATTPEGDDWDVMAWHYLHRPAGIKIDHGDWRKSYYR